MEVTLLIDQQNNLTNYSIAPSNHADWWLTSTCIHIAIACLMSSCFMSSCFMSSCLMSSDLLMRCHCLGKVCSRLRITALHCKQW